MYSLSFTGKVTLRGHLRLTHVLEDRVVSMVVMKAMRADSMCSEFPLIVVCSLLTLCFSFSFFLLFDLVTDENSESESDTEEKLKGENRK